jgi:rhodanese-related sulfurtransferase/DNA-binding transcriptional ArsR family regulator
MTGGEAKRLLNEQFARLGKALSHPRRVELLDLLAQGERSVDALAAATGMGVTNTSAQLQVLRQHRLVETRRAGTRVYYRLADDTVAAFLGAFRELARQRLSEVDQIMRDCFEARDELQPVSRDDLMRRARDGEVVVLDVRPELEYEAGHIPGAVSIPLDQLADRLAELPAGAEIVAYCRGPYCVLAPEAVALLRRAGRRARRLDDGVPEWRHAGLPVAVGAAES